MIDVTPTGTADPLEFAVTIREGGGETRHRVTLSADTARRLGSGTGEPAEVVEAAVRFLLAREPKEAILAQFDLDVIPGYFPDFEDEFPAYLQGRGAP